MTTFNAHPETTLAGLQTLVDAAISDLAAAQAEYPVFRIHLGIAERDLRSVLIKASFERSERAKAQFLRAGIKLASGSVGFLLKEHPELNETSTLIADLSRMLASAYELPVRFHAEAA